MKPRDAPEKRPSVISAVEPASPAPINAAVGPLYPKTTVTSTIKERGYRDETQPSVAYLASNVCDAQYTPRTGGENFTVPLAYRGHLWDPGT
jgi:hypothetical protein